MCADLEQPVWQFAKRWADLMEDAFQIVKLDEPAVKLFMVAETTAAQAVQELTYHFGGFTFTNQHFLQAVELLHSCWDKRRQPELCKWYNAHFLGYNSEQAHEAMVRGHLPTPPQQDLPWQPNVAG
jgi:truncated hemoglobin YjbI